MQDLMTKTDIDRELDFWIHYFQPYKNFKHKNFYVEFFPFNNISGSCLEIGCGGSPFITYMDEQPNAFQLSLVDPLIEEISNIPRYAFLKNHTNYNSSLLNFETSQKYDFIICLNVLDHFPDNHINFLIKMQNLLKPTGKVFLYYDVRQKDADDHYSINHSIIYSHIHNSFDIVKESLECNPEHRNWSTVYMGYRAVLGNRLV
jgi:2-polyprenyl-3-methyl-5-hydroxy-6-metoxy-1,4-benzoquinol methylase